LTERLALSESSYSTTQDKLTQLVSRCQLDIWQSIKDCKRGLESTKVDTAHVLCEMKDKCTSTFAQLSAAYEVRLDAVKSEKEQLQRSLQASHCEIDKIKASCGEEVNNYRSEVENLTSKTSFLESSLFKTSSTISEMETKMSEVESLRELSKAQENYLSDLQTTIALQNSENSKLRLQNEEFENNFQTSLALYESKIKELNSTSEFEIESLKNQILMLKQFTSHEISTLKEDSAKRAGLMDSLGLQLVEMKQEKMDLESKLQAYQKNIQQLESSLSNKILEISTLQTNLDFFQAQLSTDSGTWDSERSRLQNTINSLELSIEQQKETLYSLSNERESLLAQMKVTHQTMKTLQSSHDKSIHSLSSQIKSLEHENFGCKEANLTLQRQNLSLKEKLAIAEASIASTSSDFKSKLSELSEKLEHFEVDNSKLKLELQVKEKNNADLYELNSRTSDKLASLQFEHKDCLEKHDISVSEMKKTLASQEDSLKAQESSLMDHERTIADFKAIINISRSTIDSLNEKIKSQNGSIAELEKTGNTAIKELEEAVGKNEVRRGVISNLTCQLAAAESALASHRVESDEAIADLKSQLVRQKFESEQSAAFLQTQLQESEAVGLKYAKDVENSRVQYNTLVKDYEVLLNESSERVSRLETDCSAWIEANRVLEAEHRLMKESSSQLLQNNATLVEDHAHTQNSLRILQKLHQEFLESKDGAMKDLEKASVTLFTKEKLIDELHSRISTLESLLEMQGSDALKRTNDLDEEVKALTQDRQRQKDLEKVLTDASTAQTSRIEELLAWKSESEQSTAFLQTQLHESEAAGLKYANDLENSRVQYNTLVKDYEVLLNESSERVSRLETDCSALIEANSALSSDKMAFISELESENNRANELHDLNANLTKELSRLEDTLGGMKEGRDMLILQLKQAVVAKDEVRKNTDGYNMYLYYMHLMYDVYNMCVIPICI
jgi:chromosome segregation ATPase